MAQIQRKRGMVGREASLLRGVLRNGRAEVGKGIRSASIWSGSRRKARLILRSCLGRILKGFEESSLGREGETGK
jgi:hypothetical protein